MKFYLHFCLLSFLCYAYKYSSIKIKLELQKNILKYNKDCKYLSDLDDKDSEQIKTNVKDLITYCAKLRPYMGFYEMQINVCNKTAHHIIKNEVDLILPKFPEGRKTKRGIFSMIISGFVGLAFEGISSFLHNRRHKALHKAVQAVSSKADIQRNKLMHLEDTLLMYGVSNVETLDKLIKTVHALHSRQSMYESLFAGQMTRAYEYYSKMHRDCSIQHYAINSMLYLRIIKDKYIEMYNEFISQLLNYAKAIRILAKGYLPITLGTLLRLKEILALMKEMLTKTNPYYDIVIKRLHLYYDMKLVTFRIDRKRNLIIQSPVFVQPYTQQPMILYQLETVPVPVIDKNSREDTYTELQIKKNILLYNIPLV